MWRWMGCVLVAALTASAAMAAPQGERVTFESDGNTLVGFLYRPDGPGPHPALIWNHGSEANPERGPQFDRIASIFVPAGYVVFTPQRRGHGSSQGDYIVDRVGATRQASGFVAANRLTVQLLETEQLDDQLAGLAYLKTLPSVDAKRIVVAGCSYGGIATLLAAASDADYKAGVSISPAGLSWDGNRILQSHLIEAVSRIDIPVLLIQPPKDPSLEPARVLGATAARLGKPLTAKIYPEEGPEPLQAHCFGGARGMQVWAEQAKDFFAAALRRAD